MAGVDDWYTDPNLNRFVDGIDIGENCPAANQNNALRAVMAAVKRKFEQVTGGTSSPGQTIEYVTKTNGTFANQPKVENRGGIVHHADSAFASARIFVQPAGGSIPSGMANGDILIEL